MKIADAITYCIHYHKINSRPNTLANYEFILEKLGQSYQDWHIDAITTEEIIAFLANITEGRNKIPKGVDLPLFQPFLTLSSILYILRWGIRVYRLPSKTSFRNPKHLNGRYLTKIQLMRRSSGH